MNLKYHKRITRDIKSVIEEHEIIFQQNNEIEVKKNDNILKIVLTDSYPFRPPKLFIKNKNEVTEYIQYYMNFKNNNIKLLDTLYKSKKWCPCCSSIVKSWCPSISFNKIIYEFYNRENIRGLVVNINIMFQSNKLIDEIQNLIMSFLINSLND